MSISKIIILPIYKTAPSETERLSFKNNIKVLQKYPISLVTYGGLDISFYTNILDYHKINYKINFFDQWYFKNLQSYNRLLLSCFFYENYKQYDYMLITQLDVFVFEDQLEYWCKKNFDYIGAPWFENFRLTHKQGRLAMVGNGGFSLRKIESFIKVFSDIKYHNKKISLFNFWNKYEFFECHKFSFKNVWKRLRGIENNLNYYLNSSIQEDVVWSLIVPEVIQAFKVAPVTDALRFSFETNPSYLYKLNNYQLPFGCHAWHKYEYEQFWSKFIKLSNV